MEYKYLHPHIVFRPERAALLQRRAPPYETYGHRPTNMQATPLKMWLAPPHETKGTTYGIPGVNASMNNAS